MKKVILFITLLCTLNAIHSQSNNYTVESGNKKKIFNRSILPIVLITSGLVLSGNGIEKSFQKDINEYTSANFYTTIDDYTRYAPIVMLYGADAFGIPARNHWFDQTKNLILSTLLAGATTTVLKNNIDKKRPGDQNALNSFPSGHTTMAFVTATTVYEEFIDEQPVLAYSGYLFAIGTGGLRLLNNKHWLSDVLTGAGIGILATKLVYTFDHLLHWNPFQPESNIVLVPQYQNNTLGVYFSKSF